MVETREQTTERMLADHVGEDWPLYPRLPMITAGEMGIVLSADLTKVPAGRVRIYHAHLFQSITSDTGYTEFPSVEAAMEAGWRVD